MRWPNVQDRLVQEVVTPARMPCHWREILLLRRVAMLTWSASAKLIFASNSLSESTVLSSLQAPNGHGHSPVQTRMRRQSPTLMKAAMYRSHAPSGDIFAHAVSGAKIDPAIR
jgi:hypothetical protein